MKTNKMQSVSSSFLESECSYGSLHLSQDCEMSSFVIYFSLTSQAEFFLKNLNSQQFNKSKKSFYF